LFYVQEGMVSLKVLSPQGKQAVIGIMKAGDFFGEDCLIGDLKRVTSAAAMPACCLMRLEKRRVLAVILEEQTFCSLFIHYLLQRNVDIQDALEAQLFNHTEVRLARTLLLWADFDKPLQVAPLKREFTHEELAQMIGASREKVTKLMNGFRDRQMIEYNGGLKVHASLLQVVLRD
jgi:CRP/FNR family cyclic AMP-dependent transcriptional regulator